MEVKNLELGEVGTHLGSSYIQAYAIRYISQFIYVEGFYSQMLNF